MFDFSFGEILLLGVVALVVLGPEKLPHTMRMIGAWVGRIRRTVINIQAEIEKEVQAQEMKQRVEQEMAKLRSSEVVQGLQKEVANINANLHEMQQQTREALTENVPHPPLMTEIPAAASPQAEVTESATATPPGEEAFKAHVQSSHARAEAEKATTPQPAPEPEHKPIP